MPTTTRKEKVRRRAPKTHRSPPPTELDAAAATPPTERRLDLKPLRDNLEARADRDAAVDRERVARDVARRRVQGEVSHQTGDLLGGAQSPQRDGGLAQ